MYLLEGLIYNINTDIKNRFIYFYKIYCYKNEIHI